MCSYSQEEKRAKIAMFKQPFYIDVEKHATRWDCSSEHAAHAIQNYFFKLGIFWGIDLSPELVDFDFKYLTIRMTTPSAWPPPKFCLGYCNDKEYLLTENIPEAELYETISYNLKYVEEYVTVLGKQYLKSEVEHALRNVKGQ